MLGSGSAKKLQKWASKIIGRTEIGRMALLYIIFFFISMIIGGEKKVLSSIPVAMYSALLAAATILLFSKFKILGTVASVAFVFIISAEIGAKIHFSERVSLAMLKSIPDTGLNEAAPMMLELIVGVTVAAVVFSFLVVMLIGIARGVSNKIVVAAVSVSIALTAGLFYKKSKRDHRFFSDIESFPEHFGDFYYSRNNIVYGDLSVVVSTILTKIKYKKIENKTYNKNIIGRFNSNNDIVVVMMGESSLSKNYQIYGNAVQNNENLSKILNKNGSCYFNNVHSAAPITRDSVSMTLSFHVPESVSQMFYEKSIINLAKEGGYKTYWVTAQYTRGLYDTKYEFLSKESDHTVLAKRNDSDLVEKLTHILDARQGRGEKKFIFLHMIGSHGPYAEQYDPIDKEKLPAASDYDRTINKTDRVVGDVYKILNDSGMKYSILFTSDHGEIIGRGHGIMNGGTDQYLIPYIYMTNSEGSKMCEYIESLRNRNKYINALSNKFVLLKMIGYEVDERFVRSEVERDRILHSDGRVYDWDEFVRSAPK